MMMDDMFEDMPSCLALGESAESIDIKQEDEDHLISSWLVEDDDLMLSVDDAPLFQSAPASAEQPYFCFGTEYPSSSPESPPSYSSTPELPEMEGTIITVDTPPLFGEQIDDAVLFSNSFTVNPDVLPELEKILASVECLSSPETSAPQSPASPSEVPEKRAPKKRKGDDGKEIKGSDILLPRDQLLVMTSAEIETYVAGLKSKRNLTAAEEKDLKRQRRLVKNREYASQSRSRKKLFVDDLEKTIENLRSENSSLKQQVNSLSEENKTLKKKISSIATTIKKSSSSASASLSTSTSGMLTRLTTVGRPNASKTVGACLLAMMFMVISVGMLGDNQYKFQIYPISQHGDSYVYVGNGRVLHEKVIVEDVVAVPPLPPNPSTTTTKTSTNTATTITTTTTTTTTTKEELTTTAEPLVITAIGEPTTTTTLVFSSISTKAEPAPTTSFAVGEKEIENVELCSQEGPHAVLSYSLGAVRYTTTNCTFNTPLLMDSLPSCAAVYAS